MLLSLSRRHYNAAVVTWASSLNRRALVVTTSSSRSRHHALRTISHNAPSSSCHRRTAIVGAAVAKLA